MFPIVFICRAHNYSVQHTGWVGGGVFLAVLFRMCDQQLGEMIIWTLYKLERNEQSLICIFNCNGENITHKPKHTSYKSSNDLQAVIGSITDTPDLHPAAGESTSVHRMMVFSPQPLHHHGPDQRLVKGCQGCRSCWKGDNCWCSHSETDEM